MFRTVLCVDIGTSSLKTALVDSTGVVHAFKRVSFDALGYRSHNPAVWLNALKEAVPFLLAQLEKTSFEQKIPYISGKKPVISAIAVSGNGPTIACNNYLLLWNEDLHDCGCTIRNFSPSLFLPRIAYIKECLPSVWESAARFFSGPEYLIYQLCGTETTILPEQRFEAAYWDDSRLTAAGIEKDKLPPFVPAGFCAGFLTDSAAVKLGLHDSPFAEKKIHIICGAPDFIVALIGTNTLESGAICDRAGSSEGINLCTAAPVRSDGIRTLPSIIPNLFNASVLLPFWAKADYTETARRVSEAIKKLQTASGLAVKTLRVTGGQARDSALNQLKSTLSGIPVEVTALYDAELIGDAILAFCTLGEYGSIQEAAKNMVKVSKVFLPE